MKYFLLPMLVLLATSPSASLIVKAIDNWFLCRWCSWRRWLFGTWPTYLKDFLHYCDLGMASQTTRQLFGIYLTATDIVINVHRDKQVVVQEENVRVIPKNQTRFHIPLTQTREWAIQIPCFRQRGKVGTSHGAILRAEVTNLQLT